MNDGLVIFTALAELLGKEKKQRVYNGLQGY